MWLEELEYCGTQEYCEKNKYRLGVESGVEFWSCYGMPTGQPTGDDKSRREVWDREKNLGVISVQIVFKVLEGL